MENEGPWHRAWKAKFPFEWQEVVAYDCAGEKHIADVKRPDGIVIELQNSPMAIEEMNSREAFYGERMIWIVNGEKFKNHIRISDSLPDPHHERMRDFKLGMPTYTKWSKHVRQPCHDGSAFGYFLKSDIAADPSRGAMYELHHGKAFESVVANSYRGQHAWSWKNPREGWLLSRRTVVFDLGQGEMWALAKYGDDGDLCLQRVSIKALMDSLLSGSVPDLSYAVRPARDLMDLPAL